MNEVKVTVSFRTSSDVKKELEELSKERSVTISALINMAIYDYLKKVNIIEQGESHA